MTPNETKEILKLIMAFDNSDRTSSTHLQLWAELLAPYSVIDAANAVKDFFLTPNHGWLEPVHVIEGVKKIRSARYWNLEINDVMPGYGKPGYVSDDDPAWQHIRKARWAAIGDGLTLEQAITTIAHEQIGQTPPPQAVTHG